MLHHIPSGRRARARVATLLLLVAGHVPGVAVGQVSGGDPGSVLLEIRVVGLRSTEGSVRLALFDVAPRFTQDPAFTVVLPAEPQGGAGPPVWHLRVPHGTYAVAAVHDRNDNERLDTNLLGMPTEPYGFSNGARGVLGPPSFEDAAFEVRESPLRVDVPIR